MHLQEMFACVVCPPYCMLLHPFLGETEAILIASFALSVPLPIAASLTSAKDNVQFNCSYYYLG